MQNLKDKNNIKKHADNGKASPGAVLGDLVGPGHPLEGLLVDAIVVHRSGLGEVEHRPLAFFLCKKWEVYWED